jgi:hypothetical protein
MTPIERRIRIASMLVLLGLLVECATFVWKSPYAFFLFLIVGCGIAAAGILLFLVSLITVDRGGAQG